MNQLRIIHITQDSFDFTGRFLEDFACIRRTVINQATGDLIGLLGDGVVALAFVGDQGAAYFDD